MPDWLILLLQGGSLALITIGMAYGIYWLITRAAIHSWRKKK